VRASSPACQNIVSSRRRGGTLRRGGDTPVRAKSSVDCFAWQYAFYTHLLYRKAPGTAAQLLDTPESSTSCGATEIPFESLRRSC